MTEQAELLQTFAEVFAALAGFAALATAVVHRREKRPSEFGSLVNVVVGSLLLIGVCLLPLVVSDFGLSETAVWRLSSLAALILTWGAGFLALRRFARYGIPLATDVRRPVSRFFFLPLEAVAELGLLANVVGVSGPHASSLYLLAIFFGLAQVAGAFAWFLDSVFSPEST